MRIAICTRKPFSERCDELLRSALAKRGACEVDIVRLDDPNLFEVPLHASQAKIDCDYALVWRPPGTLFDWLLVRSAVFSLGAGVDLLLSLRIPAHISVVKLEDAGMGKQIADYVLAAVLRIYGDFDIYRKQQRERTWLRRRRAAKTEFLIGVLGLGSVGSRVAELLAGTGFQVRGFSRVPRSISGVACMSGDASLSRAQDPASEFSRFLTGLNILVSVLPATDTTTGVLADVVFGRLAVDAHVFNVGRGSHLNEEHLLAAVREGHLAGATLDVFQREPLPEDHPFWNNDAIVVTPHIAATMDTALCIDQIATKLIALERGELITGIVDRERQY